MGGILEQVLKALDNLQQSQNSIRQSQDLMRQEIAFLKNGNGVGSLTPSVAYPSPHMGRTSTPVGIPVALNPSNPTTFPNSTNPTTLQTPSNVISFTIPTSSINL